LQSVELDRRDRRKRRRYKCADRFAAQRRDPVPPNTLILFEFQDTETSL
jgi:hypothetical protein